MAVTARTAGLYRPGQMALRTWITHGLRGLILRQQTQHIDILQNKRIKNNNSVLDKKYIVLYYSKCSVKCKGVLAQLGEHLPYKQRVIGSSPIGPIPLSDTYGGIAQLARAHGSYPWCREFKSPFRYSL